MDILEVREGTRYQSSDEVIPYTITTTNLISDPTSPTVVVYDESVDTDVTSIVMSPNSPSAKGDVITLSPLQDLTVGHSYRVEVKFVVGTGTYEFFFIVKCIR